MNHRSKNDELQIELLDTASEHERIHHDTELLYVIEGTLSVTMRDYRTELEREDILIVNANQNYSCQSSASLLFVRIIIPERKIGSDASVTSKLFWCDSSRQNDANYTVLRRILKKLLTRHLNGHGNGRDFGFQALCYQLLDVLTTHFLIHLTEKGNADEQTVFDERIAKINTYINQNYNQPINSKELSEKLFLSQGYLSRFFKRNFGMNFAEYLQKVRLYHAMNDLIYTNTSITHIAYDNGFSNVAAFNKAFKESYGSTPSAMRKKLSEEKARSRDVHAEQILNQRLSDFLRTNGIPKPETGVSQENCTCSVQHSVPLPHSWENMLNAGAAADLLRGEVREHIVLLSNRLNFRYVRFWNIFAPELLIDLSRTDGVYNFSKLDSILDFLLANSLRPHIELGRKPRRLYRTVGKAIVEECIDHEVDDCSYLRFLRTFLKHLLRRYRYSEINNWRFEIWYDESKWGNDENNASYFALFNNICRIIKQYAEGIEVGGCGIRPDDIHIVNVGTKFLFQWKQQPCQPDFLSMLFYPYERGEFQQDCYSKRSTDNDTMSRYISSVRSIMENTGYGNTKLYVTEWNLTISDRNFINDSVYKGAYIVRNMLENYDKVEVLSYFLGSDHVSEHYDSDGPFFGGCGLVSKDGILKPAGYALRFLKWLYPYLVERGKHFLISMDQANSFGIICHNQKTLNYHYYLSGEDEINREDIWRYFDDRERLELRFNLTDVPNGVFQVKTYHINEEVGGILNTWKEMGFEHDLSRNDVIYMERICGPHLSIRNVTVTDHVLSLSVHLQTNEFRFIRMRKIE